MFLFAGGINRPHLRRNSNGDNRLYRPVQAVDEIEGQRIPRFLRLRPFPAARMPPVRNAVPRMAAHARPRSLTLAGNYKLADLPLTSSTKQIVIVISRLGSSACASSACPAGPPARADGVTVVHITIQLYQTKRPRQNCRGFSSIST